jgi:type VI secretion system protein ImpI
MGLTLTITNEERLPDGGPLSVLVAPDRGIDIGRDPYLDWVLPDPSRFISGKHCEIRHRDGDYWLTDVSTNGTYVNGSETRPSGPHRLRNGDQLEIGRYAITVAIDGAEAGDSFGASGPSAHQGDGFWSASAPATPSQEPRYAPEPAAARQPMGLAPDAMDWMSDIAVAPLQPPATEPFAEATPPPDVPPALHPAAAPPAGPPRTTAPDPAEAAGFIEAFCRGAGLQAQTVAHHDPMAFAETIGRLFTLQTASLQQLIAARAASKGLMRSANQTMIQAFENNPLRFTPTPEDALRIMLGPPSRSYLSAEESVRQGFDAVKRHQMDTLAAMQEAALRLIEELDPRQGEDTSKPQGVLGLLGSGKDRARVELVSKWEAKTKGLDRGMLDVFMAYFAQAYDRAAAKGRPGG